MILKLIFGIFFLIFSEEIVKVYKVCIASCKNWPNSEVSFLFFVVRFFYLALPQSTSILLNLFGLSSVLILIIVCSGYNRRGILYAVFPVRVNLYQAIVFNSGVQNTGSGLATYCILQPILHLNNNQHTEVFLK